MPKPWRYTIGNFLGKHFPMAPEVSDKAASEGPPNMTWTEYQATLRNRSRVSRSGATDRHDLPRVVVHPDDVPMLAAAADIGDAGAQNLLGEMGVSGLEVRGGRITQEYNAKLQNLQTRMIAFEEMRRSDSAPAAMEQLITLPIRQANWGLEDGDDKELSENIRWNLFDPAGMTHSFDDVLRKAVLAVLYGFTVHEKVFEFKPQRGGFLGWKKFAERERSTVQKWQFDSTGGLRGLEQRGRNPETEQPIDVKIPIDRLMVWTWRDEAGNPEGLGAFRQAYKHFYAKGVFETFAAIRIERQACGIPFATAPEIGADEDEYDEVLAMLKRIRTGEDAGMLAPAGWTVGLLTLGPADVPFESHIERQHQSMLQTVLGQFVGLAQGGDGGAWALSRDSSSFFLMSLEGIADWICEYFNRYAIRQLCQFNTPETGQKLPRLVHGKIGVRDLDALVRALARIFDDGTNMPLEIVNAMLAEFDFAPLDELPKPLVKPGAAPVVERPTETDNEDGD